jgi:alpha-tubulin suppressor-like RCC1 family protein
MHIAAIKTDGTLWTWGFNNHGQLGQNLGTGTNTSSPGTVAGGGTTWVSVSRGAGYATAAIKSDGTLWTCGYGYAGATARGATADITSFVTVAGGGTTWSSVATGYMHILAIKTDGTLWTCGYNRYGQLGDGTATSKTSFNTVSGGGTTWKQVAGGLYHSAAVKTDGTLWTWGYNNYGNLGNNSTANTSSPGTVAGGGTTWASLAPSSRGMAAAIKTDGTLWMWGQNTYGGLGNGSTNNSSSPNTVAGGGTTWSQVACGANHTAATHA